MNGAIVDLMRYITRDMDADKETQRQMGLEDARAQNAIMQEQARIDALRRDKDIESVYNQQKLWKSFYTTALIENSGNMLAAKNQADQMLARSVTAQPTQDINKTRMSSAETDYGTAKYKGAQPFAQTLGQKTAQTELSGLTATEAENLNRYNVARERATSAPMAAQAMDFEGMEKAILGKELASATRPFAGRMAETQARSGISAGEKDIAKNYYDSTVMGKLDAPLEAEAIKKGYGAQIAGADLTTRTGGMLTPGAGNQILSTPLNPLIGGMDPKAMQATMDPIKRLLSTALTQTNNIPVQPTQAPVTPGTLPRRPAFQLR